MLKDCLLTGEEKVRCDEQWEWKPLREIDGIEIQKKSPPPIKTSKAPPVLIARKSPPTLIGKKPAPDVKKFPPILNVNNSDSKIRSQNLASGKKALYVIITILFSAICLGSYLLWRNQETERQRILDLQQREIKTKEEAGKAIAASEKEKERVQEQLEKTQAEKLRLEREAQEQLRAKEEANKAIAASEEERKRAQEQLEKAQAEKLRLEQDALLREHLEVEMEKLKLQVESLPQRQPNTAPSPSGVAMVGGRYPETRERIIDSSFARGLGDVQLRYAINEMFARHGAVFSQQEINNDFESKPWYQPNNDLGLDEIERFRFTDIEKANLLVLGAERNFRKASFPTARQETRPVTRLRFIDSESNLRNGPGAGSAIIRKPLKGESGSVENRTGDWILLKFDSGESGWVHVKNLEVCN
jgi:hypothetical protein